MEQRRLTIDEKTNVTYCIEEWLKVEQVKLNTARVKGRIEAVYDLRTEPIALVNFGPSLNDTWEKIREFKFVMSCSGAHKFLVERGIIPTYHIDVDPRPHKVGLMGTPQKETQYLIASTCSPALFEHLKDFDLKLWHIFDTDENGFRMLPPNEWALTGGCSVGVRTITMARFLGFTDLHIFGMDGSYGTSGQHAALHPNQNKKPCVLAYDGKDYETTPSMLEAARNTWHELDMMKDTKCTFYGEGLVQAMAKKYERKEIHASTFIAFNKPELISAPYQQLNRKLHEDNLAYGVGGGRHKALVMKLAENISKEVRFPAILDYGCGKGYLGKAMDFPIAEYDPAIPGKEDAPKPADLVCCLDVLEHIEPEKLDCVLDDIRRCTRRLGLLIIHTGPSTKTLADGRNSHLIQEGKDWWTTKIGQFFNIPEKGVTEHKPLLYFIVAPTPRSPTALGNKLKTSKPELIAA